MMDDDVIKKIRSAVDRGLEKAFPSFRLTDKDTVSEGMRLRCVWTVTAGIVPKVVMPEHTRRWCLTSETWEKENGMTDDEFKLAFPDGVSTYVRYRDAAYAYASSLNHPSYLNWVEVEWMWM